LRHQTITMNFKPLLTLLLPLLAIACEGTKIKQILDSAESVMAAYPDSALIELCKINKSDFSTDAGYARFALLKTKALDKNYVDIADDSLILFSYQYYQRHGEKSRRLQAAYYLGVVYENAHNYADAIFALEEAGALAEQEGDYHYWGLSNQHLSSVYSKCHDAIKAVKYSEKAVDCFEKANKPLYADYSRLDLSKAYIDMRNRQKADSVLNFILSRNKDNALYFYACREKCNAAMELLDPDYETAGEYLNIMLSTDASKLRRNDYENLAIVAQFKGEDSLADEYLRLSYGLLKTNTDTAVHYRSVASVNYMRKNYLAAIEAINNTIEIRDKAIIRFLENSLSHELEQIYRSNYIKESEQKHKQALLYTNVIISLFIVIVLLTCIIRRRNNRIRKEMQNIEILSKEIELFKKDEKSSRQVMDTFVKDKIDTIRTISSYYFSWDDESVRKQAQKGEFNSKEDIIKKFREQLRTLRADTQFLSCIENNIDSNTGGLISQLKKDSLLKDGHHMDEMDIKVLTLLLAGFTSTSISFLTKLSDAAIRTRKTRYKQYFGSHKDERFRVLAKSLENTRAKS